MADSTENVYGPGASNDRNNNGTSATGGPSISNQTHSSNIEFIYSDTDQHLNEIAELYSYSEEIDFAPNRIAFEELMEDYGYPLKWTHMSQDQKHRAIERMAEGIEFTDRTNRIRAIRGLLYLSQGNFGDCLVIDEQPRYARKNIFHLYDYGLFLTFIQLIHYEIEQASKISNSSSSGPTANTTTAVTSATDSNVIDSNVPLRLLVNLVYLFVQEMSFECAESDTDYHKKLRQQFKEELMQPICGELLHITLFDMIVKHCNGHGPKSFPTKKTLLLLWKVLLLTMGGHDEFLRLKNHYRKRVGLKPIPDDTLEVTRRMFPASPPPIAAEIMDFQHQRKMNRPFKRQTVVKQSSFGDESYTSATNFNGEETNSNGDDDILNDDAFEPPNGNVSRYSNGTNGIYSSVNSNNSNSQHDTVDDSPTPALSGSPRSSSPVPDGFRNRRIELDNLSAALMISKGFPWQPKVRQKDIEHFFTQVRQKFLKYTLPDDYTTTAGLPAPILESIEVLKKHLYQSLGELQIKREEELARYPLTMKELDDESCNSFAEQLYRAMLPSLPQYLIALLKLLLGSVSYLKTKSESHNVLADIPQEQPTTVIESIKMKIDLNRHQEIIIKAISGIIILMLKHYKINHVYQFEYICQQMMFANCIPLIIKFLSQEMIEFIQSKNSIPVLDFPACVIGEQPELNAIELLFDTHSFSWRNMFSSINLLRILNKLTKWKNCRIIMLVIFKSSQPLKRALRVQHAMFQLYVLKLLKIQAKFLGRQWRKSNMKTMSDIYAKVRHRLNDDWAFANDVDTKSIYVQTEEFILQANIDRFHHRRYKKPYPHNITSVTAQALTGGQANQTNLNSVKLNEYISNTNGLNGSNGMPSGISTIPLSNDIDNLTNSTGCNASGLSVLNPALTLIAEADLLQPVDNNLLSVLSKDVKLTKEFKKNYEIWLEREVFRYKINWDELLENPSDASIDINFLEFFANQTKTLSNNQKQEESESMHNGEQPKDPFITA